MKDRLPERHHRLSRRRIPLVQNGAVDIECGSTANHPSRARARWRFPLTTYQPQFKWIALSAIRRSKTEDLEGRDRGAVTQGTNTAQFVLKLNADKSLGQMKIVQGKDHAESFLLMQTSRAVAFMEDDILLAGAESHRNNGAERLPRSSATASSSDPYALVVSRTDPGFKQLVDAALSDVMASGAYDKLYAKWFRKPDPAQ